MPHGVHRDFLGLLQRQRRRSMHRIKLVPLLLAVGYVVAELADVPAFGGHVVAFTVAVPVAAGAAYLAARRIYGAIEEDLRAAWRKWMAAAPRAASIVDARDRVRGEDGLWAMVPVAGGLLALANVAALLMLWFAAPGAAEIALGTAVADGAAAGALLAWHLETLRWTRAVDQAVQELYREGEIGVYGGSRASGG